MKYIYSSVFLLLLGLYLNACQQDQKSNKDSEEKMSTALSNSDTIPYILAKNYFVRSDAHQLTSGLIDTQEKFTSAYGMATTMSDDGKPTPIDFSTHQVISLILPFTDYAVTIHPHDLRKNERGEIVFTYSVQTGAQQSFAIIPHLLLIIDKNIDGPVVFEQQN